MILITGASGNVGSEVLKQAAAAGLKIRATFQSPVKASKAPTGVEAVIMDYEENIEASGLPYTFLRPNGFMQNFVNYSEDTIRTQNAFYGCQGEGAVSLIDLRDVATAAVKVLAATGHEGKSYALTGPEALNNRQVAEKLSRVAGRKISYVDLPPADLKKGMLSAGVPEWFADALLDLQRLYREGGASLVTNDFERLSGRKPISFDQFARDYATAFQSEAKAAG